jgi:hypothetical protein
VRSAGGGRERSEEERSEEEQERCAAGERAMALVVVGSKFVFKGQQVVSSSLCSYKIKSSIVNCVTVTHSVTASFAAVLLLFITSSVDDRSTG